MLYRRTIDKQILNINSIAEFRLFQSPLFSGPGESNLNKIPRIVLEMKDGINTGMHQGFPQDSYELKEDEIWKDIKWIFKDEKDHIKHLADDKNKKVYYVAGIVHEYNINNQYVKTEFYVLRKGYDDSVYRKYQKWHHRWCYLDWILQNWQIPIAALLGAAASVLGNIAIEIIRRIFPLQP